MSQLQNNVAVALVSGGLFLWLLMTTLVVLPGVIAIETAHDPEPTNFYLFSLVISGWVPPIYTLTGGALSILVPVYIFMSRWQFGDNNSRQTEARTRPTA